jgi:hypothetical protein
MALKQDFEDLKRIVGLSQRVDAEWLVCTLRSLVLTNYLKALLALQPTLVSECTYMLQKELMTSPLVLDLKNSLKMIGYSSTAFILIEN